MWQVADALIVQFLHILIINLHSRCTPSWLRVESRIAQLRIFKSQVKLLLQFRVILIFMGKKLLYKHIYIYIYIYTIFFPFFFLLQASVSSTRVFILNIWVQLYKGWIILFNRQFAIQQIHDCRTFCAISRIEIYPVDSVIQLSNIQGLLGAVHGIVSRCISI